MWANEIRRGTIPNRLQLRGAVEITQGATTITADEADVQASADGTIEYDLRGNVHVTVREEGK
jgi:lipopolysaccharide export system protein LptA